MSAKSPKISVVLLCYRSEDEVPAFVDTLTASLEEFEKEWEIILVGNYIQNSGDRTPEIVNRIAEQDGRIKAVAKVKEGMMGWDMRTGLEAATGNTVAVIDGDGQMPLEDVARVYKMLIEKDLDMAKTYREDRQDGLYRRTISIVYNLVFRVLFPGLHCRDINSKPKIFKRQAYEKMDLKTTDWFTDAEIMIQARRLKFKIGEIPTTFNKIHTRPSFVKPFAILEFAFNLIGHRLHEFRYWFKKD